MNLGNLIVNLAVNLSALQDGLNRASGEIEKWGKKAGEDMKKVGQALSLYVTAPLAAMGTVAGKAAIDFESAFAGVRKTVDATEAQYAQLERGIRDMAKTIPATANEITAVTEAAGQLGIQREAIMGFSRVMIDLGESTNLASEEAATALARFANITQMPQTQFDRLGSTVVDLGNNLATTEAEIVEMGLRLAGAGKQVGMTEAQILGFSGALSSVGIAAEAGGTAFSRVFKNIYSAVQTGNKSLTTFASVAGMSIAEFKKQFEQDAAGAIVAFIEGLGKISAQGGNTIAVLEELKLADIRVSDALLRASGAGDLFRQSIEIGTTAWQENTALTKEAEERYKTMASQLQITRNHLSEAFLIIGRDLMPIIKDASAYVREMASRFAELDPGIRKAAIVLGAFAAAIGPVLLLLGTFLTAIAPGGLIAVALAGLATPVGLVIAALAGLGVAVAAVVAAMRNGEPASRATTGALQDQINSVEGLAARYKELEAKTKRTKEEEAERKSILEKLEKLSPGLISGYNAQGEAIGVNKTALEKYNEELREKLRLEEESHRLTMLAAREKAAAARIDGVKAMQELNALKTRRDEAVRKAEERLARAEANLAKTATVGNRSAVEDAKKYLAGTIEAWDKQVAAKKAEMEGIRTAIADSQKEYDSLKKARVGEAASVVTPTSSDPDPWASGEEFKALKGIQLAQAQHSAKMISDTQYLNALKAEAGRLEKLGVTTSQEYLSVRAAIVQMEQKGLTALELAKLKHQAGQLSNGAYLKVLQIEQKKLNASSEEYWRLQIEIGNTQKAIAKEAGDKQKSIVDNAKDELEAKRAIAEAEEDKEKRLELQRKAYNDFLYVLKAHGGTAQQIADVERTIAGLKRQQADEQKRQADEAERMAKANKMAFETLRTFAQGFGKAIDSSKVDDLVAKLAAQQEFVQQLRDSGASETDILKAEADAGQTERDLGRARAEQEKQMPGFVLDNIDTIVNLPNIIGPAAAHLAASYEFLSAEGLKIKDVFAQVGDFLTSGGRMEALATIPEHLANLGSQIATFAGSTWPTISGLFGQLGSILAGGLPAIGAAITGGMAAIGAALSPFLVIIAAVVAAFALLQQIWTKNAGGIQEAFGNLMASLQGLWDGVVAVINPFVEFFGGMISMMVNNFAGVISILGGILKGIGWVFDKVLRPPLDWVAQAFRWVNDAIADLINWLSDVLPFLGIKKMRKAGDNAAAAQQQAAGNLEFPQSSTAKMASQIGAAVGRAVADVMGSFTSINPLPVEDVARANVFGIGPSSRFYYEKQARVSIDLNVTGEADAASIARAFEDSGLRSLLADTVGGEVAVRSLSPRFA